jgi:hypothetical protein
MKSTTVRNGENAKIIKKEKYLYQIVRSWSEASLTAKCTLKEAILPHFRSSGSLSNFSKQYFPLIVEDARANLAQGLNNQWVKVTVDNLQAPANPTASWMLDCVGAFKADNESYFPDSVVLFKCHSKSGLVESFLGIATPTGSENSTLRVETCIRLNSSSLCKDSKWEGKLLGSFLTYSRMYDACSSMESCGKFHNNILASVVSAQVPPPLISTPCSIVGLNESQSNAAVVFQSMATGLLMLQGPPGTGKSQTISTMLDYFNKGKTRTLVCAPSNKAIQGLALRFFKHHPNAPILLVGNEAKVPPGLTGLIQISYDSFWERLKCMVARCEAVTQSCEQRERDRLSNKTKKSFLKYTEGDNIRAEKSFVDIKQHMEKFITILERYDLAQLIVDAKRAFCAVVSLCNRYPKYPVRSIVADNGLVIFWSQFRAIFRPLREQLGKLQQYVQSSVLNNSTVIFCTLSVSGRNSLLKMDPIQVLIVDEAGQSVEAETLIAFQHNPRKVLLVGDTKQLPATVISTDAKRLHYDWSMLHRLIDQCKQPALMLNIQYRMHPAISAWPSRRYYNGALRDGTSSRPQPADFPSWMHPCAFYNIDSSDEDNSQGSSFKNEVEASYLAAVVTKLRQHSANSTIGIITPYAAQVACITQALKREKFVLGQELRVNSVDGFQGDECDYIFISFVRSNKAVGFVDDKQRLNVAITRARYGLFMVGKVSTFQRTAEFQNLFKSLRRRRLLFSESDLVSLLCAPSIVAAADASPAPATSSSNFSRNPPTPTPAPAPAPASGSLSRPSYAAPLSDRLYSPHVASNNDLPYSPTPLPLSLPLTPQATSSSARPTNSSGLYQVYGGAMCGPSEWQPANPPAQAAAAAAAAAQQHLQQQQQQQQQQQHEVAPQSRVCSMCVCM